MLSYSSHPLFSQLTKVRMLFLTLELYFPLLGTPLSARPSTRDHSCTLASLVLSDRLRPTQDSGYGFANPTKGWLSYPHALCKHGLLLFIINHLSFSIVISSGKLMKMILNKNYCISSAYFSSWHMVGNQKIIEG